MTDFECEAQFSSDYQHCTVRVGEFIYPDLRVKQILIVEGEYLYTVLIPCAADVGQNYMLAIDRYALAGCQHPEAAPLFLVLA